MTAITGYNAAEGYADGKRAEARRQYPVVLTPLAGQVFVEKIEPNETLTTSGITLATSGDDYEKWGGVVVGVAALYQASNAEAQRMTCRMGDRPAYAFAGSMALLAPSRDRHELASSMCRPGECAHAETGGSADSRRQGYALSEGVVGGPEGVAVLALAR